MLNEVDRIDILSVTNYSTALLQTQCFIFMYLSGVSSNPLHVSSMYLSGCQLQPVTWSSALEKRDVSEMHFHHM